MEKLYLHLITFLCMIALSVCLSTGPSVEPKKRQFPHGFIWGIGIEITIKIIDQLTKQSGV